MHQEKLRAKQPKQEGPEGRTGRAGHGPHCLTSLSEPTRKLAVFQPPRLKNGALATAKQQGPEGRTGPAGHGPHCLTSLSEPTRKLPVFQPPRLKNGALATAKQQGPEGRTGPAGHGPHCLTSLSEPTRKLAVWPAGPVRPSGPCCFAVARAPFLSLGGWKTASFLVGSSSRQGSKTAPSPQRNSRALKDGPGLRATAPTA